MMEKAHKAPGLWELLGCIGGPAVLLAAGTAATFLDMGAGWARILDMVQLLAMLALGGGLVLGILRTRRMSMANFLRALVLVSLALDTIIRISWLFH